jgi:uncharacterized membrane protein YfcA
LSLPTLLETLPLLAALLTAGGIAGLSAGLFGVGGGFVVVPALLLSFSTLLDGGESDLYVAVGTSLATIIVTSVRSVQAHSRRGSVDFDLLKAWAPWIVIGVVGGVAVAAIVETRTLLLTFGVGVAIYAVYFLRPTFVVARETYYALPTGAGRAALASSLSAFSALLGIGGGTPFVVTMVVCGRPVHQAVGTAAGIGFFIAVPGAIGFALMGLGQPALPPGSVGYVNLPAFAAIALVSIVTTPLGARLAHSLSDIHLRKAFGVYLLLVSAMMFYKYHTVS